MTVKMLTNLTLQYPINAGCNNGNYIRWAGIDKETGEKIEGYTCACFKGCSELDVIVKYHEGIGSAILVRK